MTLSLRLVQQAHERHEVSDYLERQEDDSRVTIGDLFGSVLAETQAARRSDEGEPQAAAAEDAEAPEPEDSMSQTTQDEDVTPGQPECSSSESPAESEAGKD
jgi:hypothetical protein